MILFFSLINLTLCFFFKSYNDIVFVFFSYIYLHVLLLQSPYPTACLLSFLPIIDENCDEDPCCEIIIVLDRSGSMRGESINNAKETLQLILRSLPLGSRFQIISFGTKFSKMFEQVSVEYSDETIQMASAAVRNMKADMQETNILPPLLEAILAKDLSCPQLPRQVFVLTDGRVNNTRQVINKARMACDQTGLYWMRIKI